MPWPLSQDYNEALQNPQTSFSDPELRRGEVLVNALGIPQPCSGNFADVYAVECPDTRSKWAVKCFTREVHGLRERYSEISSYLQQVRLPFTVDFQYLDQGIRIAGRWYPILKMNWVEGLALNTFVRDLLDKPAMLEKLSRIWVRLARRLREAGLAHGDLQHGNILLVPDSGASALAVKLVDYDGMWVPALANVPSGEFGHPAYQHPRRLRESAYDAEVDRFGLLAVYVALRALAAGGRQLWQRYDVGDNLLFRQADFETPAKSPLFAELLRMNRSEVHNLAGKLIDAARLPLEQTPHLADLVAEEKPAKSVVSRSQTSTASSGRTAAATAESKPFQDIEPEEATRDGGDSLIPWIAAGSVAACAVIGGVLLWGLQPSDKPSTQPALAQAKHAAPSPEEIQPPVQGDKNNPPQKARPQASASSARPDVPKKGLSPPAKTTKSSVPSPPSTKPKSEDPPAKPAEAQPSDPERPPISSKLPAPDEAVRKKATEDIRFIYKSDYDTIRRPEDRVALAVKLLKRGMNQGEEAGRRFVYLSEARDLAARGGDAALSLRAIDEMTRTFAIEPLPMKTAALELAAKALRRPEAAKRIFAQTLTVADEAESADDYEQLAKLLRIAQSAAFYSGDPYLPGVVAQRRARLNHLQEKYAKIADAVKTLADKPEDAEANLTVGKFHCFDKEDWNKGLPMLARGADSELAQVAGKDLDNPVQAPAQAKLGQQWWDFAENQSDTAVKSAVQRRAQRWFWKALPLLAGDDKVHATFRLEKKVARLRLLPGLATGLFAGENFEKLIKARLDYKIDYDWGTAAPDPAVPADHFSIRWQGWLIPPRAGKYTLTVSHDDGVRLFFDDKKVIESWGKVGQESVEVVFSAQPHRMLMEFHEQVGPAHIHLSWSLEGSFKEQTVPLNALYHDSQQERFLAP